jgi:breast cancer 2 susceptibility protein
MCFRRRHVLTVGQAFPVAYIEFIEEANGRKGRQGPHDAKEESKLSTQWKVRQMHPLSWLADHL